MHRISWGGVPQPGLVIAPMVRVLSEKRLSLRRPGEGPESVDGPSPEEVVEGQTRSLFKAWGVRHRPHLEAQARHSASNSRPRTAVCPLCQPFRGCGRCCLRGHSYHVRWCNGTPYGSSFALFSPRAPPRGSRPLPSRWTRRLGRLPVTLSPN